MRYFIIGVMVVVLVFTSNVAATIVSFDMSVAWNGASPEGAAPWLNATFDDQGAAGDVILTITAVNLTLTEKVWGWYFNLDPLLDPDQLIFSGPSKSGNGAGPWFDDPDILTGSNAFKADGDGSFDLLIQFETADGGTHSFEAGDSVEYTISGIGSLMANSFYYMSDPEPGGAGEYITTAHVLGIGEAAISGWVTIPEPAMICLLGLGGLLLRRRKNV